MNKALLPVRPGTSFDRLSRLGGALVLAGLLLLAAGCGSTKTDSVTGKVTLDGELVKAGLVTFFGAANERKVSHINGDGSYRIDHPPGGTVKVTITSAVPNLPMPRNLPKASKGVPLPPMPASEALPKKYENPNNGLTLTIEPGQQTFDIALTQ
jgi:hypothetical protein